MKDSAGAELQGPEMPTPHYFDVVGDDGRAERWVGIQTEAFDGTLKRYLFYRNVRFDLSDGDQRVKAAFSMVEFKVDHDTDIAFGPAIDLEGSNPETEHVEKIDKSEGCGMYVEESRRKGVQFLRPVRDIRDRSNVNLLTTAAYNLRAKQLLPVVR